MSEIMLDPRFQGPPTSANGGYICGVLASQLGGAVEVTLKRPPPLSKPLLLDVQSANVRLLDGEMLIAEGHKAPLVLGVPPAVSFEDALKAQGRYRGFEEHAYAHCFVCGPARAPGDGLRIFAGPVAAGLVAAAWVPDDSLADSAGNVRPEFIWSALDCPGYFAAMYEGPLRLAVLGRMHGEIVSGVKAGGRYVAMGWQIASEGRKHITGTAVYSVDGVLCGRALGTWIELR
jgi:hypothetical protein